MKWVVLSDIHANHLALRAILDEVEERYSLPSVRFAFLGDLLGYGPLAGALACVEWLETQENLLYLPGNHDEWVAREMGAISKIANGARVSLWAQHAYLAQQDKVKPYFDWVKHYTKQQVEQQVLEHKTNQAHLFFTHGDSSQTGLRLTYLYPWEKTKLSLTLQRLQERTNASKKVLFCGHTHFPMNVSLQDGKAMLHDIPYGVPQPLDDCVILNGGSVGQPRDGDPRASFLVYDEDAHTATFWRVEYPVNRIVDLLKKDRNYASSIHPLKREAREEIIELAGDYSQVESAYESLIARIQTGDGGAELAKYREVYQFADFGLKVVI